MTVRRRAAASKKEVGLASKSLDELADEIDARLGVFELQVANLLECARRGYPPKTDE